MHRKWLSSLRCRLEVFSYSNFITSLYAFTFTMFFFLLSNNFPAILFEIYLKTWFLAQSHFDIWIWLGVITWSKSTSTISKRQKFCYLNFGWLFLFSNLNFLEIFSKNIFLCFEAKEKKKTMGLNVKDMRRKKVWGEGN